MLICPRLGDQIPVGKEGMPQTVSQYATDTTDGVRFFSGLRLDIGSSEAQQQGNAVGRERPKRKVKMGYTAYIRLSSD